jgi:hypothetical protein
MLLCGCALLAAAFLPPVLRTLGFIAIGAVMVWHYTYLVDWNLGVQIAMYVCGGACFIRSGGHSRWPGCSDHHLLHYLVTVACCMHVGYIRGAMEHRF